MKKITMVIACVILIIACNKNDDPDPSPSGGGNNNVIISVQDSNFVLNAAMINYAEVRLAQLAGTQTTDSMILSFAMMVVNDQTMAQQQLQSLADSLMISAPDSLDSVHVAIHSTLMTFSGHDFDSAYIHSQVTDYATAISLFQTEITSGTNERIASYAKSKMPALQMHKNMADSIAARY